MNRYEAAKGYLLQLPEVVEDYPFGPEVMVAKICGKMFATLAYDAGIAQMNLKCDPSEALMLRDLFTAVKPGYHMNKKHWNTVILDGSILANDIQRMVDNSYLLVVAKLPKVTRSGLRARCAEHALFAKA